jgi:hypothetical protein
VRSRSTAATGSRAFSTALKRAMEMADEEAIGRHRAALERFLGEHDGGVHGSDKEQCGDDWHEA